MRSFVLLIAIGCLSLMAASPSPQRGGELRVAIQGEPRSPDPHVAADEPSGLVAYLTHGVLVRTNRLTQKPEPELATAWKQSADGRTLTLALRKGLQFSDGTSFSADDVCFSINRILDPALDAPNGDAWRGAAGKITCRAQSLSVTLQFERPVGAAERWLDGVAILSPKSAAKEKAGLGPFNVRTWHAGSHLILERNRYYWKRDNAGVQLPYLNSIRLDIQRNRDIELMRFEAGELDMVVNLAPDLFERLKSAGKFEAIRVGASMDAEQLWFSQVSTTRIPEFKRDWFRSRVFRSAVSMAIRRDDLARVVYRGHATPAVGPVSPANLFWFNSNLKSKPADPQAALALLKQEGFQFDGRALRDRKGNPVEVSIITNAGNKSRQRMAALIQQDLAAIGIRLRLVELDFPSLIERITKSFDYEGCLLGLVGIELDPNSQMNVWLSSAANHQWNPNQKSPETSWEAEVDKLMREQAGEVTALKRKKAWDRVQEIVVEQAPFIYLVHPVTLAVFSPRVANVRPVVLKPNALWNAEWLYLKDPVRMTSVK